MASAFITNALQVNFDSVLGIQDNEGMEIEQFFDTAMVQDGDITCAVSGKYIAISEDRFAGIFNLPTDVLTDFSVVPNDLVSQARTLFSKTSVPVQFSFKKRKMKYAFRLFNDILAKSITVKAGSFDAVTHERFLMMTAINFGIKVNWSKIIFEVLKEMADRTTKRSKGFAAQICIATNKTIDAHGESDEPEVAKVSIVKKKSVSKKKSASIADKDSDDVHVEVVAEKAVSKKQPAAVSEATVVKKKRTTSGKAVSKEKDLALISVAQYVEPISIVPAERPHKRKAPKRKLRMTTSSDDEIVEKSQLWRQW
ncbi:hypothetical protein F511_06132 [Dorcoceras hygrometricum]|uniref:Splicing factor 3B subunit 1-like n=1 Tax=Dorcoceras hygrometricum TaxID=472368 RepID=A0A2Z7BL68_9LAMI|nr:hypothetical protein F511_06132 [Dorcoceras hygrometricum]